MAAAALSELVRFLPQLAGVIARLLKDPRVPRRAKVALGLVAVYLASPVDLIPDFVPGLGYLDDALLVAIVLDGLLNHVDRELVLAHWASAPRPAGRCARPRGARSASTWRCTGTAGRSRRRASRSRRPGSTGGWRIA